MKLIVLENAQGSGRFLLVLFGRNEISNKLIHMREVKLGGLSRKGIWHSFGEFVSMKVKYFYSFSIGNSRILGCVARTSVFINPGKMR